MVEPGKFSKFQTQKPLSEKIKKKKKKKKIQSSEWLRYFQIFKKNIFSSTLKSMGIQCIHMVFEKEKG